MSYIRPEVIAEVVDGTYDCLALLPGGVRHDAYKTATRLIAGGMGLEEAAITAGKLSTLVDNSLRAEWMQEYVRKPKD